VIGDRLGTALPPLTGLIAWGAQFGAIYAVAGLVCAGRVAERPVLGPLGLLATATLVATAGAVVATLLALVWGLRRRRASLATDRPAAPFLGAMAVSASLLALLAIVYTAVPTFIVPTCPGAGVVQP
jgi:hypothetical protein